MRSNKKNKLKPILNIFNKLPLSAIILFSTNLYLYKIQIFSIPFNLLELLIIFLLPISLYRIYLLSEKIFSAFVTELEKIYFKLPFKFSFGLILLGFLLATFAHPEISRGLGAIKGWLIIPLISSVIFWGDWHLIENKKKIKKIVIYLIILNALFTSLASFLLLILNRINLSYDYRLKGFFESPNMVAIIISLGLISLISSWQKKYLRLEIKLGFLLTLSIALLLTRSVGALIGISTGFVLVKTCVFMLKRNLKKQNSYQILDPIEIISTKKLKEKKILNRFLSKNLFLKKNKKISFQIITGLYIAAFGIAYCGLWLITEYYYLKNFYGSQSTLTSHFAIWRTSFKLIWDNFIFGIEPNTFLTKYIEYQKYYPPYPQWDAPHPHNVFLMFWLYGGLIGFLGFLNLIRISILSNLKKIYKLMRMNPGTKIKTYWLLPFWAITYILIHGLVDNTILKNDLMIFFVAFVNLTFL
jgi:O-antigen ligase